MTRARMSRVGLAKLRAMEKRHQEEKARVEAAFGSKSSEAASPPDPTVVSSFGPPQVVPVGGRLLLEKEDEVVDTGEDYF